MSEGDSRTAFNKDDSTVVLFTNDDSAVKQWAPNVVFDPQKTQDVTLVNERKIVANKMAKNKPKRNQEFVPFDEAARPTTKVAPK